MGTEEEICREDKEKAGKAGFAQGSGDFSIVNLAKEDCITHLIVKR